MATVSIRNGRAEVRFYDQSGIRRQVALGKIPKRDAESAAKHIQSLVNSKIGGGQSYAENVQWASQRSPRIVSYLAGLGLIPQPEVTAEPEREPVKVAPTIQEWFNRYIENRPASEGTKAVWNRTQQQAVKFFGKDRPIDSIETGDAITWFESMRKGKGKLAEATARKMLGVARQVFKRALKFKHIAANPFSDEDLKTSVGHRDKEYIDVPTIQQVLTILPSAEWRAVVAFARFAGMRVQSELRILKWSDVQWDANRFVVRSPKTKQVRRVPIFPEIRKALEDLLPITGESEFVLNVLRTKSNNWGTPLMKMLNRAGFKEWEAPFNSLRASGEIDIARTYGLQCATEWCGNSVQVAMKHYVRATDADFERASERGANFAPKDAPVNVRTEPNDGKNCTHIAPIEASGTPEKRRKPNKNGLLAKTPKPVRWSQQDLNL